MKIFVESEEFRNLNCGFALDEGEISLNYKFAFFIFGCTPLGCVIKDVVYSSEKTVTQFIKIHILAGILTNCSHYQTIRHKYYQYSYLSNIFQVIPKKSLISFIKEINFCHQF